MRPDKYEKNGLRFGERVCCIDVPRMLGTVLRCDDDGVDVRWDDGTLGQAVWDQTVAHNAYRFQVVRGSSARVREDIARLRRQILPTDAVSRP